MQFVKTTRAAFAAGALVAVISACSETLVDPPAKVDPAPTSCGGIAVNPTPSTTTPATMPVLGVGYDTIRYTGEVAVRGSYAYVTSWGNRRAPGNKITVWDVSANCPVLVDSVIVSQASTIGDVAISDDGKLLVVATEFSPGSIVVYDLADPKRPQLVSRFTNSETSPGVHTAEIGRVNGKLYAFLSVDPSGSAASRLVIVDLSTPSAPKQAYVKQVGNPYVHDTYVRDGYLFLGLWNNGVEIWDIGGGGSGASPESPRVLSNLRTLGGQVHNIWWYHDPSGSKRYAFIGQEGPGSVGSQSSGDIHVVDVSNLSAPREVGVYSVPGAGTHNFSVDETHGVLYAAYYNGGVRAIDIRGDLGTCTAAQQNVNTGANLTRCDLRLMGRELGVGLIELGRNAYVWGVQYQSGFVYASDMRNGLWKLAAVK
jgi:hypothetical protein